MSADASLDASLAAHIAAHLRLAATRRPENADALEVAAQCVCEAYGLEPSAPVGTGAADALLVHEEAVLVTETGCEVLSERAPREMPCVAIGD